MSNSKCSRALAVSSHRQPRRGRHRGRRRQGRRGHRRLGRHAGDAARRRVVEHPRSRPRGRRALRPEPPRRRARRHARARLDPHGAVDVQRRHERRALVRRARRRHAPRQEELRGPRLHAPLRHVVRRAHRQRLLRRAAPQLGHAVQERRRRRHRRRGRRLEAASRRVRAHQPRSCSPPSSSRSRSSAWARGDFHTIAREMGVPDGCIAVQAQATPSAIRQVFRMVSQSAIRASQGRIAPGPNAGFFSP